MIAPRLSRVGLALALLAGSAGLTLVTAKAASACIADDDGDCWRPNYQTQRTDGSLAVWSGPGTGSILYSLGGNGTQVEVVCEANGRTMDGQPYTVWDQMDDGGWVYGYYLTTPGDGYHPALTLCNNVPPPQASGITATATGTGTVHVSWSDNSYGQANYQVGNGSYAMPSTPLPRGTTSYDWTGMAPNTSKCFNVLASNTFGNSGWTSSSCTTTWPGVPTNVTATATGPNTIHVSWTAPAGGAEHYAVINGQTNSPDVTQTSFDWTGISPHTYMCFAVTAKSPGGQGAWTPWACATTQDPPWCPAGINCSSVGAFQPDAIPGDFGTVTPDLSGIGTSTPSADVTLITDAETYPTIFNAIGAPHAADFFSHYMDATGSDHSFNALDAYNASANFKAQVDAEVKKWMSWYGASGSFDSGYRDFASDSDPSTGTWNNNDWHFAMGHCYYRVVGTWNGSSWSVHLQLTSYYQFRPNVNFNIPHTPIVAVYGSDMRHLVEIGFAQDYREIGNGDLSYDSAGNRL